METPQKRSLKVNLSWHGQHVVLIGLRSPPSENPVGHGGKKIPQRLHSAAVYGSSEAELMRTADRSRHGAPRLTLRPGDVTSSAQTCPSDPPHDQDAR